MLLRIASAARWLSFIAIVVFAAGQPATAWSQEPPPDSSELRVGISPFAPFVVDGPSPEGYSIDLWEEISRRIDRKYKFVMCKGAADKLERLQRGELDVAIGGLTTSRERESQIDFTHATYRSGLGIMLAGQPTPPTVWDRISGALSRANSTIVIAFILFVVVAGNLVWLFERGKDSFDRRYLPGLFEGMYWVVVTASTVGYGDKAPLKYSGRILAMIIIIISLPMFALFTAELASAFTLQSITAAVSGPEDLIGKKVGVIRGTSSARFAAERGLSLRQVDNAEQMYETLLDNKVAAVIYDAPSLKYFEQTEGQDKVYLAERTFDIRDLAIATRQGSALREQINRAILDLEATGEMTELRVKWFGSQ